MHHQDNFDDPTSVTLNSYQQIATNYAQRHAESIAFWHECMQRFVSVLRTNPIYQTQPSLPVMDAGCGPGRDSLFLAQLGFAVLAVDLSDAMLAEARKRCQDQPRQSVSPFSAWICAILLSPMPRVQAYGPQLHFYISPNVKTSPYYKNLCACSSLVAQLCSW